MSDTNITYRLNRAFCMFLKVPALKKKLNLDLRELFYKLYNMLIFRQVREDSLLGTSEGKSHVCDD